jgi:hypothetical protein
MPSLPPDSVQDPRSRISATPPMTIFTVQETLFMESSPLKNDLIGLQETYVRRERFVPGTAGR